MDKFQIGARLEMESDGGQHDGRSGGFGATTLFSSITAESPPAGETPFPAALEKPEWTSPGNITDADSSELPYSTNEIMCRYLSLALTLILFPAFITILSLIYIIHKSLNGVDSDFFYRGERLGRGKKIFQIYKIRTLKPDSEQRLGCSLHQDGSGMEVRGGGFLRASRLDELPQLINVLRGDMDLVGPRPLRPAVYEFNQARLPDYDRRFLVRPGLTGVSQLLTPHSTPKRIRSYIDNHYARTKNPAWDAVFVARTIVMFLINLVVQVRVTIGAELEAIFKGRKVSNRRKTNRLRKTNLKCRISSNGGAQAQYRHGRVVNVNQRKMRLQTDCKLDESQELVIDLEQPLGRNGRVKRMRINGTVVQVRNGGANSRPTDYIIEYRPASDLDKYLVDKYFLKSSIA